MWAGPAVFFLPTRFRLNSFFFVFNVGHSLLPSQSLQQLAYRKKNSDERDCGPEGAIRRGLRMRQEFSGKEVDVRPPGATSYYHGQELTGRMRWTWRSLLRSRSPVSHTLRLIPTEPSRLPSGCLAHLPNKKGSPPPIPKPNILFPGNPDE